MDDFEAAYSRYYRDVYRFALFLTSDPAWAEDLAAETLVRAWGAFGRIRQPTVKAYLLCAEASRRLRIDDGHHSRLAAMRIRVIPTST